MRQYECTFIVDPILSGDEIKQTAEMYIKHLKDQKCEIVHVEELGIRQLAYPILKRTSGAYFIVEFSIPDLVGDLIDKLELAFRRDDRVIRYLTVKLDKHGVKYNQDKRAGLIGRKKEEEKEGEEEKKEKAKS